MTSCVLSGYSDRYDISVVKTYSNLAMLRYKSKHNVSVKYISLSLHLRGGSRGIEDILSSGI
jgi:hypothetical protein